MPLYFARLLRCHADIERDYGLVKIGFSVDPERRIQQLQCAAVETLIIVRLLDAAKTFEKRLHKACEAHHVKGELFRWDPEMLRFPFGLADLPVPEPRPWGVYIGTEDSMRWERRKRRERRKAARTEEAKHS